MLLQYCEILAQAQHRIFVTHKMHHYLQTFALLISEITLWSVLCTGFCTSSKFLFYLLNTLYIVCVFIVH